MCHTQIHACLINKEVFPHDEVFRACECRRVACPHANWPQMACSLWMIQQWADFWFLLLHYQFLPLLLAEFLNLVSSLGLFYSLYKNVSWARWPIPTKEGCIWQSSSRPLLVTLPQQMPAAVLAPTTLETRPEPHDGELGSPHGPSAWGVYSPLWEIRCIHIYQKQLTGLRE